MPQLPYFSQQEEHVGPNKQISEVQASGIVTWPLVPWPPLGRGSAHCWAPLARGSPCCRPSQTLPRSQIIPEVDSLGEDEDSEPLVEELQRCVSAF